ncbi:MAG: hypothetical protein GY842_23880 [bacterium]|nr:hypothetical protein [bacterium]
MTEMPIPAHNDGLRDTLSSPEPPTEGARETADSIVVAFILAFVFRAFIIEAFVIPTGSMAATLYGRHGTMLCADCGWEFAYGLTDPSVLHRRRQLLGPDESAVCPNCEHANLTTEINDRKRNSEAGDRILALKWPYDIGSEWLGPKRWDVTLFKDPSDQDSIDGVTNFIKRMVGVPNEVLEIVDGDVYATPLDQLSEQTRAALEDARHAKYLRRSSPNGRSAEAGAIEARLRKRWPAVLDELGQEMQICRKTPLAQSALWTVLYNHDFPPRTLDSGQPHWAPIAPETAAWDAGGRKLRFAGGESYAGLILRGKQATDRVAYNIRDPGESCGVTDFRLRFVATWDSGESALLLNLSKRGRSFWAELRSDGCVNLYETQGDPPHEEEPLATERLAPFEPGAGVVVDLQCLDYRVALSLDGEEFLATTPDQFAPDLATLRTLRPQVASEPVRMFARGAAMVLTHVVVERDVYYRSPRRVRIDRLSAVSGLTGTVWGGTGNPILLREGEFFMLGDNSPASGDSRLWSVVGEHLSARGEDYQLGTVARDQLIGRAFFVYWPSGHRSAHIPVLDRLGIIPNVGRMRWIR